MVIHEGAVNIVRRIRESARETRVSLAHDGALKDWPQDAATIALLAGRGVPRRPQMAPYEYRDFAGRQMPNGEGRVPFEQELVRARAFCRQIAGTSSRAASAQTHLTRDPGG